MLASQPAVQETVVGANSALANLLFTAITLRLAMIPTGPEISSLTGCGGEAPPQGPDTGNPELEHLWS
jgi:hypothetical protein